MKKINEQHGITLVALVITIIILLILAAITIGSLRNSRLFERAKDAEKDTTRAQEVENQRLKEYDLASLGKVICSDSFT